MFLYVTQFLSTHSFTQRRKHYDQRTGRNGNGPIPHHLYCGAAAGCCAGRGEESVNSCCSCYSYWGNPPCRNCISRQVLEDRRQRTKLEYRGSEVFQVTAVYREVDGVPCIMELVQKLDAETLIDPETGTA